MGNYYAYRIQPRPDAPHGVVVQGSIYADSPEDALQTVADTTSDGDITRITVIGTTQLPR